MGLGWEGEADQRETNPPLISNQKARRKGQLPPSMQQWTVTLVAQAATFPTWVPGPCHPPQPQELTFGCPSRRSLWNTWQNFQQSTALLERGSRLTTDQKVCAPFSWWVPSMHGEGGSWKTMAQTLPQVTVEGCAAAQSTGTTREALLTTKTPQIYTCIWAIFVRWQ